MNKSPLAYLVHCFSHRLKLYLQKSATLFPFATSFQFKPKILIIIKALSRTKKSKNVTSILLRSNKKISLSELETMLNPIKQK